MNNIFIKNKNVNNSSIYNVTKKSTINNTENILDVKGFTYKTYKGNSYNSQVAQVEDNLYKRFDNIMFNNTRSMYKHINQYPTDVFNNYKINKTHNVKKTCYNFIYGVVINTHDTIHTNGTGKINNTFDTTGNQYFTKNI